MGATCCKSDGVAAGLAGHRLDEEFGIGTADACQRISELLLRVELKVEGARTLSHPFMVNLGMVLKQAEQERRYRRPFTSGSRFEDARVLRKAARYARYAAAAQFADKRAIADYIGGLQTEDVKHVQRTPFGCCPGYFVAVDPETDDIVLSICGASTAADALALAVCSKAQLLAGRAHSAILHAAALVVESAVKLVMSLSQEMPRKGIALVGHSVGGGAAALATIMLSADGCPFSKLMAAGKVKCYTYGAPPTFEPLWALPAWVHSAVYAIVHKMDCVPRACVGTVSKLYLALKQVDELPLPLESRLAYLRGEGSVPHVLPDCADIPQELATPLASLYIVGTILVLFRGPDGSMRCEGAAPHMMDRLLVHPAMVYDHSASCYQKAFEDLQAEWSRDGCTVS